MRIQNRALLNTYHSRPCSVCFRVPSDPCHIRSKGAGGHDLPFNLIPMCREHHVEQHKVGWDTMRRRYFTVDLFLKENGWEKLNGRLWNKLLTAPLESLLNVNV